jgi:recombinational DNA repair protein (RecF pathway)
MQIRDTGVIVAKRISGEKSAIMTLFTKEHGRIQNRRKSKRHARLS